jgi:hypothetical protein
MNGIIKEKKYNNQGLIESAKKERKKKQSSI